MAGTSAGAKKGWAGRKGSAGKKSTSRAVQAYTGLKHTAQGLNNAGVKISGASDARHKLLRAKTTLRKGTSKTTAGQIGRVRGTLTQQRAFNADSKKWPGASMSTGYNKKALLQKGNTLRKLKGKIGK